MNSVPRPHIPDHEVLRIIGSGAYGTIWLARSLTGTFRAVKVISRGTFAGERSFQREFDGMSSFEPISRTHEGFVHILHVGRGDGFFYYIMELADDVETGSVIQEESYRPKTLKSELDTRGRLPAHECLNLALSLTETLSSLHERKLTHRDIKPSNIIFVHGVPKLADIGLVAASGQESFVGTEGYVPPEGPGTPQADIFSLGKVLYEISMGKDRLDFPEVPTGLGEMEDKDHLLELNEILFKACAAKLKRRYSSAREMLHDLHRLKQGQRRRTLLPIAGLILLIIILGAAFSAHHFLSPPPKPLAAVDGSLEVNTEPAGAMVFVDDRVQHSPSAFKGIPPGSHHLRVLLSGFEPVEQSLDIASGQHLVLPKISLIPKVGTLNISSDPEGASFSLQAGSETIREGKTPATISNLPEGTYKLVGKNGNLTSTQTIAITAKQTIESQLTFLPGNGSIKITSAPGGATVIMNGREIGHTPLLLEEIPPGELRCQLRLPGYKDVDLSGMIDSQRCTFLAARLERIGGPEDGKPWTNSLGMIMKPLGKVRFCIWDTRVKDFAAFCQASGQSMPRPDFEQTDDDPVVMVSWNDAMAFCHWLTTKERNENLIRENQSYRLPTDLEWSEAAGLPPEGGDTPESRDGKFHGNFPWGNTWPPPPGVGNYADQSLGKRKGNPTISNYVDGWAQTSPVGHFPANAQGLYDLGGNVWEWCLEGYKGDDDAHDWGVLRGGSWATFKKSELESSYRNVVDRSDRDVIYGFRCVLGEEDTP